MYIAYNMAMIKANIADLKNNFSRYIASVEKGEEIEINKRNVPIAKISPLQDSESNSTVLGCGKGSVIFFDTDLSEPMIPEKDWEMLK